MAPIVPATLSQFGDLINESIQNIFVMRSELPRKIDQYFNVSDTTSYYDKDSSVVGTERAKYISENASVIYDAPIQGFDQVYTQRKYGDGLKISDHLWKFGIQFRNITALVDAMMDAMDEKVETDGADMLNNGFSTSYTDDDGKTVSTAGGDSAAYFSASHTREDGKRSAVNLIPCFA